MFKTAQHQNNRREKSHQRHRLPTLNSAPRLQNLLIAGASGHVAGAFLLRLQKMRQRFGRLLLLDADDRVLRHSHLDHAALNYAFVRHRLKFPRDTRWYQQLLHSNEIDVVIDLTDMDTMPILAATDAASVSYVNSALNDSKRGVAEILADLHPTRERRRQAPHIISSGMNPGVVNIWVWDAFHRYGKPTGIVHFEYDTSVPLTGWRPTITWSPQEFLTETVWERTGLVVRGRLKLLAQNAVAAQQEMREIMQPVLQLDHYPRGFLVLHEENVKLGQKLGASSKYLYAIHPRTMKHIERTWRERGHVDTTDLEIVDNTSVPLDGADTIGLCLEYPGKRVYYLHSLHNADVVGTSATCAQVAVGVEAALVALSSEDLAPRIYFASDLYETIYRDVVFSSLRVEHFVFPERAPSLTHSHSQEGVHSTAEGEFALS